MKCRRALRQLRICGSAAPSRTISVRRFWKSRVLSLQDRRVSFKTDIAVRILHAQPRSRSPKQRPGASYRVARPTETEGRGGKAPQSNPRHFLVRVTQIKGDDPLAFGKNLSAERHHALAPGESRCVWIGLYRHGERASARPPCRLNRPLTKFILVRDGGDQAPCSC